MCTFVHAHMHMQQTDRQAGRQTDRQAGRQTDRQTDGGSETKNQTWDDTPSRSEGIMAAV